jgi:hypothetical protein
VSLVPVGYPGRYVRFDSAMPMRWPMCNEPCTYGWALCMWDLASASSREYLMWMDAYVDDPTFRSDATFRRIAAANGNPAMTTFTWHQNAARHIRHASYQAVAWTVSGSGQQNDASFTLEQ